MHGLLYALLLLCCFSVAHAFCPSQCTCTYHGKADGTGTRSVLCNDADTADVPLNVPVDTVKLRVEKTAIRRIPAEAFYYLVDLRYLWVTYNAVVSMDSRSLYNLKSLHELRLDGNLLTSFPWESLRETPALRTLDLHNNRLSIVPVEAARYLLNITYLDLSSNKLTSLPSDLMDIWPPFSGLVRANNSSTKVVLGLQDNPWICDCQISKLVELSKMVNMPVALLDPVLVCSGPENLVGVAFQRAELDQCIKPSVMTSATKITSPLGSNVLMRCDTTGYPTPTLLWTRRNGLPVTNTVVQESPGEGMRWSILSLNGILYKDTGEYRCRAKNVAGTSEASITLAVAGMTTTVLPTSGETGTTSQVTTEPLPGTSVTTTAAVTVPTTPTTPTVTLGATQLTLAADRKLPFPISQQRVLPLGNQTNQGQKASANKRPPPDVKSGRPVNTTSSNDQKPTIKDIQVAEETTDSVLLLWKTDGIEGNVPLIVVYSPYEEKDKQTITTEVGKGQVVVEGLKPNTKYMACLIAKGSQARRDQCITFFTLEEDSEDENQLLMIASGIACALALPIIALLLYKILNLCCKKERSLGEEELSKETYVKFETLTLKQRTAGEQANELWARRETQESERMLLCSRSSIDSQVTYKSDGSRSEFLC
ncbi:leucine-rich repeat, immunoglobulin-like domain and transmembrane domain-containing protein 3 [Megalops cyprinoides]|uniref:leucine-rich repeat, immunoglobulin-like domain and transmembrane domain-containing protein 3 n=1 Tax=Megalops cyprinoides TaxID=118141 RepID=UPI0018643C3A|nr:leucine-rich repeat, immunoglobulin-like domain and transmembrane domain-containing protein 3 [Megalops cyprinoides]